MSGFHNVSRRGFLGSLSGTLMAATSATVAFEPSSATADGPPLLVVATDLFRPHDDPDDHWDLVTAYALAASGAVELLAVLIDHSRPNTRKNPDIDAVAQLNYLTGLAVPVIVGTDQPFSHRESQNSLPRHSFSGIRALMDLMEKAPRKVTISVAGSCRDIAWAARLEPSLFREKCARVYLNAGTSKPDGPDAPLEWNVTLDPAAYMAMFSLPCHLYWMPCFEDVRRFQVSEFATYYRFRQGDILGDCSPRLRNFFAHVFRPTLASALSGEAPTGWLDALASPEDSKLSAAINDMDRNMWCTAGFLHAAGLSVSRDGQLLRPSKNGDAVFTFEPVSVSIGPNNRPEWSLDPTATDRFIFHVTDRQNYLTAMTAALKALVARLQ